MPQGNPNQEALLEAVKKLELTSELFDEENGNLKYATDLEVIVRGRDYGNGKESWPGHAAAYLPGRRMANEK